METYIQTIRSLDDFNPQSLASEDLEKTLISLKQQLLKTEAATLGRLSNLLNLVFKPEKKLEPKLAALRKLDSVSLIICGLCLTQKTVDIMRKELFDVLLEEAVTASQTIVKVIAKSEEINKVVLNSSVDEDFLQSKFFPLFNQHESTDKPIDHLSLRRMVNGTIRPSLQYSLSGSPSWCYSKIIKPESMQTTFPRLLNKAVRGYVTTFLPSEESTDGLIRVMALFDQNLLRTVFGCAETGTMSAGMYLGCHY